MEKTTRHHIDNYFYMVNPYRFRSRPLFIVLLEFLKMLSINFFPYILFLGVVSYSLLYSSNNKYDNINNGYTNQLLLQINVNPIFFYYSDSDFAFFH